MSTSSQTLPTSDLRSTAHDTKRSTDRKHKPAAYQPPTAYVEHQQRPRYKSAFTISNTRNHNNSKYQSHGARSAGGVVASVNKISRKHDKLDDNDNLDSASSAAEESASASGSDDNGDAGVAPDSGVTYSFDAARGPSQGSQILNVALAKAMEKYEEKETVKLVRTEYDVLDSEGESVGLAPASKKGKAKSAGVVAGVPDADDDYEFV
ncbi:hypothetical protein MBLNU230_g5379t1 [Neophaeotheca triangularis]